MSVKPHRCSGIKRDTHLTYNSIHNMTHYTDIDVCPTLFEPRELTKKIVFCLLLLIYVFVLYRWNSMRNWSMVWFVYFPLIYFMLLRVFVCVELTNERGPYQMIWWTCLNMSIRITIQSGWNENWSDALRIVADVWRYVVSIFRFGQCLLEPKHTAPNTIANLSPSYQ